MEGGRDDLFIHAEGRVVGIKCDTLSLVVWPHICNHHHYHSPQAVPTLHSLPSFCVLIGSAGFTTVITVDK